MRKHGDNKLVTIEKRRNYLVSESNYHTAKFLTENLLATEMEKMQMLVNKPVYLGLSIEEESKLLMYEFWYDYVKHGFILHIKIDYICKGIAEDVENRFDTSNYELNRPLLTEKNKKVIGLMEAELGEKIITKLVEFRARTYSYLIDDGSKDKKVKGTEKCVIKKPRKFEYHKNCLEAIQLEYKINYLEKIKLPQIILKKIIKNS